LKLILQSLIVQRLPEFGGFDLSVLIHPAPLCHSREVYPRKSGERESKTGGKDLDYGFRRNDRLNVVIYLQQFSKS
jgi:hypothetical protein